MRLDGRVVSIRRTEADHISCQILSLATFFFLGGGGREGRFFPPSGGCGQGWPMMPPIQHWQVVSKLFNCGLLFSFFQKDWNLKVQSRGFHAPAHQTGERVVDHTQTHFKVFFSFYDARTPIHTRSTPASPIAKDHCSRENGLSNNQTGGP
jgi:hypothetical protein